MPKKEDGFRVNSLKATFCFLTSSLLRNTETHQELLPDLLVYK